MVTLDLYLPLQSMLITVSLNHAHVEVYDSTLCDKKFIIDLWQACYMICVLSVLGFYFPSPMASEF